MKHSDLVVANVLKYPTGLAVADVLEHPIHGLVSYQPDIRKPFDGENIQVRDQDFKLLQVAVCECKHASATRRLSYWDSLYDRGILTR